MAGPIVRTYGNSLTVISGDSILGQDALASSNNNGGDIPVIAGAGDGTGNGGSVNISTGAGGASGVAGAINLESIAEDTAGPQQDRGDVVIRTTADTGTGWCHRTLQVEVTGIGSQDVLTWDLPNDNGQNLKIRVYATMVDVADPDGQAAAIQERTFYRDSSALAASLPILRNDTAGSVAGASISLTVNGSGDIVLQAFVDTTETVEFTFMIDYQYSGD